MRAKELREKRKYEPYRKQKKYRQTYQCPFCYRMFEFRWEREKCLKGHQLELRIFDED